MKEKILYYLPSAIFNTIEVSVIILTGILLELDVLDVILTLIVFAVTRMICKGAMHYKSWKKCMIWSTLQLTSLFLTQKIGIMYGLTFTIFAGITLSKKGNIADMFMWTGRNSKYDTLKKFVSIAPNNPIILEHESYWRTNYPLRYRIFQLYFRENKTYEEIRDIEDFPDNTVIKTECKTIYSILEQPLNLPPIN